jgi:hypothetical protein
MTATTNSAIESLVVSALIVYFILRNMGVGTGGSKYTNPPVLTDEQLQEYERQSELAKKARYERYGRWLAYTWWLARLLATAFAAIYVLVRFVKWSWSD